MKKKQNKILLSIIIILILVVIGVIAFIIFKNIKESEEQQNYNNLSSSYASDIQESSQESNSNANKIEPPEDIDTNSVANPINFSDLKNINSDIYSWIYIPNTNINYPVCQSQVDDNYYLDHDVYFNSSYSGQFIRSTATAVIILTGLRFYTVTIWQTALCLQICINLPMQIFSTIINTSIFIPKTENSLMKLFRRLRMMIAT